MRVYNVSPDKITVTPNGWQHMLSIKPSSQEILSRFNLQPRHYFLSLSTIAPNKNLKWVLNVARNNPKTIFAIAGSLNPARFGMDLNVDGLKNVEFLGYVSDEDFVTLAKNCKAFVFPSLYEGFGIPPLEAMCVGASVVVSNIPVLKEIFSSSAYYINPYEKTVCLESLLTGDVSNSEEVLDRFSWEKSAGVMKKCFHI
jgi:glycosyltransferase involved in cell wall biosynthesis